MKASSGGKQDEIQSSMEKEPCKEGRNEALDLL